MADVQIREATREDRPTIKDLHATCFSDEMALDDLVLENLFVHPYGINLVATVDEEDAPVAGYAGAIHGARPTARLLTIHVHPEHRRQGVASRLLDHLEARLIARRADGLELEVHAQNHAAQRLYDDRGYDVVREDPTAYPSVDPSRGYVMRKELSAPTDPTKQQA